MDVVQVFALIKFFFFFNFRCFQIDFTTKLVLILTVK